MSGFSQDFGQKAVILTAGGDNSREKTFYVIKALEDSVVTIDSQIENAETDFVVTLKAQYTFEGRIGKVTVTSGQVICYGN